MDTQKFIQQVASGEASAAKDTLADLLSNRAFEALDYKKQEIATTLYNNGEDIADSEIEEDDLLTQEEFDALSEEDQELYLEALEQFEESSNGVDLTEDMMGYKIRQKHQDKWRIHSPSGEHIGDVTRHENGYRYHGGHATKWDGSENSPHYKTGIEKTKAAAAKKVANIHKSTLSEEVEQLEESSNGYEVKQSRTDSDVHHVHYNGKKIGSVYGNKKGMWGHEYHPMGTGDDGYSSKKEAVDAVKDDHRQHLSMKEEVEQLDEIGDTPAGKKALGSYVKKRVKQLPAIEVNYQMAPDEGGPFGAKRIKKFKTKVNKGIGRAVDRLAK